MNEISSTEKHHTCIITLVPQKRRGLLEMRSSVGNHHWQTTEGLNMMLMQDDQTLGSTHQFCSWLADWQWSMKGAWLSQESTGETSVLERLEDSQTVPDYVPEGWLRSRGLPFRPDLQLFSSRLNLVHVLADTDETGFKNVNLIYNQNQKACRP